MFAMASLSEQKKKAIWFNRISQFYTVCIRAHQFFFFFFLPWAVGILQPTLHIIFVNWDMFVLAANTNDIWAEQQF